MFKRFFPMLAALALSLSATQASAFWNTPSFDKKEVSAAYRIEAKGSDIRVYEWTPTGNSNYVCVAVFASTPTGQSCLPKTDMAVDTDEGPLRLERIAPENAYKVEALGWDVRVYEWPLQSDPGIICSASFANAGPNGVTCYPKELR